MPPKSIRQNIAAKAAASQQQQQQPHAASSATSGEGVTAPVAHTPSSYHLLSSTPSHVDDDVVGYHQTSPTTTSSFPKGSSSSDLAQEAKSARKFLEEEIQWLDVEIFRLESEFLLSAAEFSSAGGGLLSSGLHVPPAQTSGGSPTLSGTLNSSTSGGMIISAVSPSVSQQPLYAAPLPPPRMMAGSGGGGHGPTRPIALQERVFTMASTTALASVEMEYARSRRGALMPQRKRARCD
jgi:hypothetical protein